MSHSHDGPPPQSSAFEELLRLQSSFQQSLTDATMNYLRQLQGLVGPVTPGTVVQRTEGIARSANVAPGGKVEMTFRVENRQRVHSMVTPMLSPLVSDSGTTWFADAQVSPATALLASDEVGEFTLALSAPKDMPVGIYRGAILIYGAAAGVIPLEVKVAKARRAAAKSTAKPRAKAAKKTATRSGAKNAR